MLAVDELLQSRKVRRGAHAGQHFRGAPKRPPGRATCTRSGEIEASERQKRERLFVLGTGLLRNRDTRAEVAARTLRIAQSCFRLSQKAFPARFQHLRFKPADGLKHPAALTPCSSSSSSCQVQLDPLQKRFGEQSLSAHTAQEAQASLEMAICCV